MEESFKNDLQALLQKYNVRIETQPHWVDIIVTSEDDEDNYFSLGECVWPNGEDGDRLSP